VKLIEKPMNRDQLEVKTDYVKVRTLFFSSVEEKDVL
jgi:hypothetical protein